MRGHYLFLFILWTLIELLKGKLLFHKVGFRKAYPWCCPCLLWRLSSAKKRLKIKMCGVYFNDSSKQLWTEQTIFCGRCSCSSNGITIIWIHFPFSLEFHYTAPKWHERCFVVHSPAPLLSVSEVLFNAFVHFSLMSAADLCARVSRHPAAAISKQG